MIMLIFMLFVASSNIAEVVTVVMMAPQRNDLERDSSFEICPSKASFDEEILSHPFNITSPITSIPKYKIYTKNSTEWTHAWEYESENVTVLAYQGSRTSMNDRFVIDENINNTGVSLYAVFDGYDGNLTVNHLAYVMMDKLRTKIINIKKGIRGQILDSYLFPNGSINYTKLLHDEVITADQKLLSIGEEEFSGSTVLLAVIEGNNLHIAHVADSRAVMCNMEGNTIILTEDHHFDTNRKEINRVRVMNNGEYVCMPNGMTRVIGAKSYKECHPYVIPDPEILSYDLIQCKCKFLILCSDGVFQNYIGMPKRGYEQTVIKHLNENLEKKSLIQAMMNVFLGFDEKEYNGDNKTLMLIKTKRATN